jgi:hypothetical protein
MALAIQVLSMSNRKHKSTAVPASEVPAALPEVLLVTTKQAAEMFSCRVIA